MNYQIFWGGADIHPYLYGEPIHPKSGPFQTTRDFQELDTMNTCIVNDIPMIGVCRGAQLLAVFNKHKLHQHIDGHLSSNHKILFNPVATCPNLPIFINEVGDHHQAILHTDYGNEYEIIAASEEGIPEIVYYPKTKAIAIQGHPEWDHNGQYKEICNNIIKHYLKLDRNVFK